MLKLKKITKIVAAIVFGFLIGSCENEQISTNTRQEYDAPQPKLLSEIENGVRINPLTKTSNIKTIWASKNGAYFEKTGDTIIKYPANSDASELYTVWNEGANFTYISRAETNEYLALPIWSSGLALSYKYDFDTQGWIPGIEVRFSELQSDPNIRLYFSQINEDSIRFGWYIDAPEDFNKYTHDIFLDGNRIEKNHTFVARGNYFHIFSLNPEQEYTVQIIARDVNDPSIIRYKRFTFRTPEPIVISEFTPTLTAVTQTGFTIQWDEPQTSISSPPARYDIHLSSNILGTILGRTTDREFSIDSLPVSKDVDFRISVVAVVPSNRPGELYYTEYKRAYVDQFQLLP